MEKRDNAACNSVAQVLFLDTPTLLGFVVQLLYADFLLPHTDYYKGIGSSIKI